MYKAIEELGVIPVQHTCGKADPYVGDYIEIGAKCWTSVQPTNDIEGILEKYGDRFSIMGGYDTNGAPGQTKDLDVIRAEVHRCIDTYGKYDGYIFFGVLLANSLNPQDQLGLLMPMVEESVVYAHRVAGK